jgi:putative hydrolase of the HAD superfamily
VGAPDSAELISTILFDADGVMQRTAPGWEDELTGLLSDQSQAAGERFLLAIQRAERTTMDGGIEIRDALGPVLVDFEVAADVDDVLELWTRIEANATMIEAVQDLRRRQVRCYLASNQSRRRAGWMRANLGYDELFEEQFYSCELGLAKPDPAYFTTIIERLGLDPAATLFVDDTAPNIDGARSVGLNADLFRRGGGRLALEEILDGYAIRGG